MKAGKLRHRVEIQERTITQDTYGDAVPAWETVAERWAEILPQSGRETWQAQQVRPDVSHLIRMRYYAGLSAKDRLKMGTRIFNIESVLQVDEVKREHLLACKEEV